MAEQSDCFEKNLAAMEAGGQGLALEWLRQAEGYVVEEIPAASGETVFMIAGQSQASRVDPRREAEQWLERQRATYNIGGAERPGLFGFGNPWLVEGLLRERPAAFVFEPNPELLKAVFSRHDFSAHLAANTLTILTPWQVADGLLADLAGALLLVHPPAQRREAAQLVGLNRALAGGGRDLAALSGRKLRIMVVPPLSGGSWPVAVSLAKAVTATGHHLLFMDWDPSLKQRESAAHQAPEPEKNKIVARLFEELASTAASAAAEFAPDLILALAQAPLDAAGLAKLRESSAALMAFWLVEDVRHFGYVAKVAPFYDVFFHIQEGLIEPYARSWGLPHSFYLPMAADSDLFQPLPEGPGQNYAAALSFMGAGYPNRRRLMGQLAKDYWPNTGRPAQDFRIFGSGWNGVGSALKKHLFENGRRVTLPECALIYARGRVNLNIHSSFQTEPALDPSSAFVNPRTFEIAAAASLQIVDSRPLLPPLFENGREVICVERAADLPEIINHWLAHPEEAAEIGRAARARVLGEHTYQHRLARLLSLLGYSEGS